MSLFGAYRTYSRKQNGGTYSYEAQAFETQTSDCDGYSEDLGLVNTVVGYNRSFHLCICCCRSRTGCV